MAASDTMPIHSDKVIFPTMPLAIFDLDNTLLDGDSDYLWGRFLVSRNLVDADSYDAANKRFYQQYVDGSLDIDEFLRFSLHPLTQHAPERLYAWREEFVAEQIRPRVLQAALDLVDSHSTAGHTTMIITATNRFITEPIAALYSVNHLLATTPAMAQGRYTGATEGPITFREGKVHALKEWMSETGQGLADSWFYSDSLNDIPLLEQVDNPVAVNPDASLRQHAEKNNWKIINLRD